MKHGFKGLPLLRIGIKFKPIEHFLQVFQAAHRRRLEREVELDTRRTCRDAVEHTVGLGYEPTAKLLSYIGRLTPQFAECANRCQLRPQRNPRIPVDEQLGAAHDLKGCTRVLLRNLTYLIGPTGQDGRERLGVNLVRHRELKLTQHSADEGLGLEEALALGQ